MREREAARVGLSRVGRHVRHLRDVVRHLRQPLDRAGREAVGVHLQHEVRGDRHDVGVAGALAVAVHDALDLEDAGLDAGEGGRHRAPGVVVGVDAERDAVHPGADLPHDARDVRRERAAVRVAEHQALGPLLSRRLEHADREVRVSQVAVEEVLGVEEDVSALGAEMPDGVADHRHALVEVGPERLLDVDVPALAHERDRLGPRVEEIAQDRAVLRLLARPPGHPERDELRVVERLLRCEAEELRVARVRARPTALDVGQTELVELVEDPHAILHRVGKAGRLRAVT